MFLFDFTSVLFLVKLMVFLAEPFFGCLHVDTGGLLIILLLLSIWDHGSLQRRPLLQSLQKELGYIKQDPNKPFKTPKHKNISDNTYHAIVSEDRLCVDLEVSFLDFLRFLDFGLFLFVTLFFGI